MKRIAFISILLSALCFGCGEENRNNDSLQCGCKEENMNNDPLLSLEGTRWKLAGIVDTKTCSLKELDPGPILGPIDHRTKCYTLAFDTDSTFSTFSSTNELGGGYIADYKTHSFQVTYFGGTKVGESGDGALYSDIFWYGLIQSFFCTEKELRLYYNDNKNYLLYKSQ